MKFCSSYDGDELVEDFGDVEVCFVLVLVSSSFHFSSVFFHEMLLLWFWLSFTKPSFYLCLQAAVDDWKVEFMYTLMFREKNEVMRAELPKEIQSFAP